MAGRQKSDTKRDEILAAASTEFAHRDFHEVLMEDVSARAGVGKGTLYRYFPTKEELFMATVFRGLDEFHQQFLEMFEQEAPLEKILRDVVERMLSYFSGRSEWLTLLQRYEHRLPQADADRWRERRAEAVRSLATLLSREARAGGLRSIDPELAAVLLLGMVRTAVQSPVSETRATAKVAHEIVGLFLHGALRPSGAEAPAVASPRREVRRAHS